MLLRVRQGRKLCSVQLRLMCLWNVHTLSVCLFLLCNRLPAAAFLSIFNVCNKFSLVYRV